MISILHAVRTKHDSLRRRVLEKAFLLQLAHETMVDEIFGFGLSGFGFGGRQLANNSLEAFSTQERNCLDMAARLAVSGFKNLRILNLGVFLDRPDRWPLVSL